MPLDVNGLIQGIKAADEAVSDKNLTPEQAREIRAQKMAQAFYAFVTGGEVETVVTGFAGQIPVTGKGTGKVK